MLVYKFIKRLNKTWWRQHVHCNKRKLSRSSIMKLWHKSSGYQQSIRSFLSSTEVGMWMCELQIPEPGDCLQWRDYPPPFFTTLRGILREKNCNASDAIWRRIAMIKKRQKNSIPVARRVKKAAAACEEDEDTLQGSTTRAEQKGSKILPGAPNNIFQFTSSLGLENTHKTFDGIRDLIESDDKANHDSGSGQAFALTIHVRSLVCE